MSSLLPLPEASPTSAISECDRARARAWLRSDAVVDPLGAVRSWHNPRHPGFDYPEAAGLWLSAFAGSETASDALADRVAGRLAARVIAGEVGREGIAYTFDLGVALAGLLDHVRAGGRDRAAAREAGRAALLSALEQRRATDSPLPPRWSTQYGPHLLKLAAVLVRLRDRSARSACARLLDDLGDAHDRGRYLTAPAQGPGEGSTYLHAHCYAAEGLWCIARAGFDPRRARAAALRLARACDWLADVQGPDGGLPRDHDGTRARGPSRADATAQAIRIWALTDPRRHGKAIARARRWLSSCTTAEGALRYEPGSEDLNTWATIFSLQATRMTEGIGHTELPW